MEIKHIENIVWVWGKVEGELERNSRYRVIYKHIAFQRGSLKIQTNQK